MQYKPGLPEHNDNVSHEHPLKGFIYMLVGLTTICLIVYLVLGALVDFTVERITPEQEREWFNGSILSNTAKNTLTDEAKISLLNFEQFESLKECAGINIPIDVYLADSETVNAIAIPGGSVMVFQGLVNQLHSENGLAFVLAHELAHFKHRDHLRAMGRGLVIGTLAAIITGSDSGLSSLTQSTAMWSQAQFSQSRESAADAFALDILNCAYGHVGGAREFFESMLEKSNHPLLNFGHYFSSHPETAARIDQLKHLIKSKTYSIDATLPLKLRDKNDTGITQ